VSEVDRLIDGDASLSAEVVVGVFVGDGVGTGNFASAFIHRVTGGLGVVGVGSSGGDADGFEDPLFVGVEQTVAVGVAGDIEGSAFDIVNHGDVAETDVTAVGYHVGPGDRAASRDEVAGCGVGLHALGELLDVDAGIENEDLGRIVVIFVAVAVVINVVAANRVVIGGVRGAVNVGDRRAARTNGRENLSIVGE